MDRWITSTPMVPPDHQGLHNVDDEAFDDVRLPLVTPGLTPVPNLFPAGYRSMRTVSRGIPSTFAVDDQYKEGEDYEESIDSVNDDEQFAAAKEKGRFQRFSLVFFGTG